MKPVKDTQEVINKTINTIWLVAKAIIEGGKEHPATLVIIDTKGDTKMMDMSDLMGDRDLLAIVLKAHQEMPHVAATIFITEAWMAAVSKEEVAALKKGEEPTPPSQREDKQEILMFLVESRDEGVTMGSALITRNPTELHPVKLVHASGEDHFEGRLVGGLSKPQ
jgi:hypothetical protein